MKNIKKDKEISVEKNNIVSKVLFYLSAILFLIFVFTIFFGGQKIGGSIYFIYFVTSLSFAFLDRKYHSNFINMYRFSAYLADLFNILAVASLIYYRVSDFLMIISISLLGCCLLVDLFAKNRLETRRPESILTGVLNCLLMFAIFPYFFNVNTSISFAILVATFSGLILVLKCILMLVPVREEENGKEEQKTDLIIEGRSEEIIE